MLPDGGFVDVAYIALQVEDEAAFATHELEMALPLEEVLSTDCNVIKEESDAKRCDAPLRSKSSAPRRPIYDLSDSRFGPEKTDVAGDEQNIINLTSSYSPTYTTENGRFFTRSLSAIVTAEEFQESLRHNPYRFIMWPTHPPDDTEILDGDYGSTTNWKFAFVIGMTVGGVTKAQILNILHPEEGVAAPSLWRSMIVTFDTPSRFLTPKGRYLDMLKIKHAFIILKFAILFFCMLVAGMFFIFNSVFFIVTSLVK